MRIVIVFSLISLISFANTDDVSEPPKSPITVTTAIYLITIPFIDPPSLERPEINAKFELTLSWKDERLPQFLNLKGSKLSLQDNEAVELLDRIFTPELVLLNGEVTVTNQRLKIYKNGNVVLRQIIETISPVDVDLQEFPFDRQNFIFNFTSPYWSSKDVRLSLDLNRSGVFKDAAPSSFNLKYESISTATIKKGEKQADYDAIRFMVHGKRDPRYYLWRLLVPLYLIVFLSWSVFWMQRDKTSAISRCFVLLLTVVAFHQIANHALPIIPFFTFIDALVFLAYIFVIIPTFEVIVAYHYEKNGQSNKAERLQKSSRWLVPLLFLMALTLAILFYFA